MAFLETSKEIFDKCEKKEIGLLNIKYSGEVTGDVPPTSMMKVIRTMQYSIKNQLKKLEEIAKDYDEVKVIFQNRGCNRKSNFFPILN